MKISVDNQTYDFPDGTSDDEINDALKSPNTSSQPSSSGWNSAGIGQGRTAGDVVRDLGAGAVRGLQGLTSGALETGEYLTRKGAEALGRDTGHPVNVPYWNARQFMGLEGPGKTDLGASIQSKNPDWMTQAVGGSILPALSGGTGVFGQMAAQGINSAAQASPNESNALGLLPTGRLGAGIEGSAFGALPFAPAKIAGGIKNAINSISPGKTYEALLSHLGQGKSIPENIQELGNRLGYGSQTAREEALTPKHEVMQSNGEQRIFPKTPSNVEEAITGQKPVKGEYLNTENADEHYSGNLQEAHDNYVDDPSFKNSDVLRSRLFKRINVLNKRQAAQTITDSQENELRSLTKNRNAIINDQDNLIKTFSPENQQKYGKFNQLWRNDVRNYEDSGATIKNLKNGYLNNVTPQSITKAFSFPELKPKVQKVLKDIGPSGINNIVFNELGRTTSAEDADKLLDSLQRDKGFAPHITPEIKSYAQTMKNQLRNKKLFQMGTGGLGGTFGLGALYELGKRAI